MRLTITASDRDAVGWVATQQAFAARVAQLDATDGLASIEQSSILWDGQVVGVLARWRVASRDCDAVFISEAHRGIGIGDGVVQQLVERKRHVIACADGGAWPWYVERGFRVVDGRERIVVLEPPTLRRDLRPAASACLWNATESQVLLGQRKTDPWRGFWVFPGGKSQPGETAADTARRELVEETGVCTVGAPAAEHIVYVASGRGQIGYRIVNVVFAVQQCDALLSTEELEPRWFNLDSARLVRPIAAGTLRILRQLGYR